MGFESSGQEQVHVLGSLFLEIDAAFTASEVFRLKATLPHYAGKVHWSEISLADLALGNLGLARVR